MLGKSRLGSVHDGNHAGALGFGIALSRTRLRSQQEGMNDNGKNNNRNAFLLALTAAKARVPERTK